MTNVNFTSGKSDGKASKYVPENYVGFKVFIVLLILAGIALVALFANIKSSHAMGYGYDVRANACRTSYLFAAEKVQTGEKHAETDGWNCGIDTVSHKTVKHSNNNTPTVEQVKPVQNNTSVDNAPVPAVHGNPGNDKPVGNSGEKCDKGMCENSDGNSGEHGKSNND